MDKYSIECVMLGLLPSVLLASGNVVFVVAGNTFRSPALTGIRWGFLAAFFALTAVGLFSYLRNSRFVGQAQLYTAVNIYLLLGLLWAALYLAIDAFYPGSIQVGSHPVDRQTEFLIFQPGNTHHDRIRRYPISGSSRGLPAGTSLFIASLSLASTRNLPRTRSSSC